MPPVDLALAQLAVDVQAHLQRQRVGHLVVGDEPGANRAGGVEGLAHRHRRRAKLPVTQREVVADHVAGDDLARIGRGDVAAALADHHAEFDFVVELVADARQMHFAVGRADARHLLVEPDLDVGHSDAGRLGLGHMLGVVHADGHELLRVRHGGQQLHLGQCDARRRSFRARAAALRDRRSARASCPARQRFDHPRLCRSRSCRGGCR